MAKEHIASLLKKLPKKPGVYKFKDEEGKILYVGKAKNLSNRVRSYFRKQVNRPKRTEKLVENTADFEWIEVGSDLEALMLETNLIKEYRPKYNVLMKDDKNFVYIKITKNEDYPRIKIVRKVLKDGARYFGPKTASGQVRKTLLLLQKLFLYRSCDLGIIWEGEDKAKVTKKTIAYPCLDYHIKRCAGPCIGKIAPKEYMESINKIELFLEGKTKDIENMLKTQMTECVAEKRFEKAALLRDRLNSIHELSRRQLVTSADQENLDIFAFVLDQGKAYANLFNFRDGKLLNQENFIMSASGFEAGDEAQAPEVMESILYQYYEKASDVGSEILVPIEIAEPDFFVNWIRNQAGKAINLKTPSRGKKNKLIELAKKNAESFMKQHKARWAGFETHDEEAMEDLQSILQLEKLPKRIEAYDISHLAGTDTVASMVVFENGLPKKSDYRKFRLKTLEKGEIDDFKSMEEILGRRLAYLSKAPKGLSFRKATKSRIKDINSLRELRDEAVLEIETGDEFEEYYLAFFEKKVIAMLRLTAGKNDTYLLRDLFVEPEHRGHKLGRDFIKWAVKKNKPKRVYIACKKEMIQYYEEFGFEKVKSIPKDFEDLCDKDVQALAYDPSKNFDASFNVKPSLIVIDGGKGQLSSAMKAKERFDVNVPFISLAKREEDIFLPGKSLPLMVPKDSKGLMLLQRLRNEAHRFAISFQKKSRKKYLTESRLDKINGLGDTGKMKLLQHFGSLEQLKKADEAEVAKIVGPSLAGKIMSEIKE
jgi:excinuclease ABC subunit C